MKKILLLSFVLITTISVFSQSLNFMGIPIQGQKSTFIQQLERKGFTPISDTTYVGTFYSFDDCVLMPIANDNGEMTGVVLELPHSDNWNSLNVKYNVLRQKIKKDFGEVDTVQEQFYTSTKPTTAEEKYKALNNGACKYQTTWITDDGGISLFISHLGSRANVVRVVYLKKDYIEQNVPHMKFKGIPFDIPSEEFIAKLKKQGYKYVQQYGDFTIMSGDFAGYSDCGIFIKAILPDDVIAGVGILFSEQSSWNLLQTRYNNIKSMLMKKYGEPASCIEEFDSYRQPSSNIDAILLLQQDKCKYETVFYVESGIIKLQILNSVS